MIGQKGMPAIFGGVERHVHELSVRLVKSGHSVTAYSRSWYTKGKSKPVDGVKIQLIGSINTKHLDTITHTLLSTIHAIRNNFDVIHYHGVGPALLSWIPRVFAPRVKVITTFHSIDRKHEKWGFIARTALRFGERATCKFAHQTIAVSRTIQQYIRDVYNAHALYIPNGVPNYERSKETNELKKWNLTTESYIVIVTRLIPHKGTHYAIAAYKKLCETNPEIIQGKKLVIVGDGYYTDSYVSYLKGMAVDNPNIIFTSFQSGKALEQLFSHAYLMIHPSNNEGLPITVLEGMSYGLPILVSDIPEHRELIHDTDFNFAHGDINSLKRQIVKILKTNREKLKAQGENNRSIIKSGFAWDDIVKDIIVVYETNPAQEKQKAISIA